MTDKIVKTPEEWKAVLTPEQFEVCINKGNRTTISQENITTVKKMACTNVSVVENHYSNQIQNLIQDQVGQVFGQAFQMKKSNTYQIQPLE